MQRPVGILIETIAAGIGGRWTKNRKAWRTAILVLLLCAGVWTRWALRAQSGPPAAATPGALADGPTLLPNGWRLAAAGRHLTVGDLPLNVIESPDARYLVVSNNGIAKPSLMVVDIASWSIKSTTPIDSAWYGLVWHPDGARLYSAGAEQNNVQEFSYANGVLTRARTFALPGAASPSSFAGGLAVSRNGKRLYVTRVFAQSLSSVDLDTGTVSNTVKLDAEPYGCVVSADGRRVYVSLWGGARVQVFDADTLRVIEAYPTDEHPNALLLSPDGSRLFIACGSSGTVSVYSTSTGEALESIYVGLFPNAPRTSTPNSLALSPDGRTLLVANADNNALAVVDVSNFSFSQVSGFIPTGWYPTGAIFSRDGRQIFALSGKGLVSSPNPTGGAWDVRLRGAVSAIPTPDRTTLTTLTKTVYTNTPYTDANRLSPPNAPVGSPIPQTVGGSSPIRHVFYIIRENRTYDQVLGDLKQGNGSSQLTLFPRDITPNAHSLAETFVLFDNFYVDADVSYDGHAFSTAAYATDVIQKMWQAYYGGRGGMYLGEGEWLVRNLYGNLSAPQQGYIWDFAARAGVTVRSYGEFVRNATKYPAGDVVAVESVPGLKGKVAPAFAAFDLDISDNRRVDTWTIEFNQYVQNGNLPQLSIIHLGNDHTAGTRPGAFTPRAMMADNDLALGRVVETISRSVYWKDSAIFVLEDDAQSGPDHVDSHRSIALVASPFARRRLVDHTLYTTSGVLRTMELILGLPPMSHYDGAATPMYAAFQATPDLTPYSKLIAAVAFDEKNLPGTQGAALSQTMNFADADLTPEEPLNEIIWRSVKGPGVPMPPPRRSVFTRSPNGH
jgi:YVTN family beta-propeller protein